MRLGPHTILTIYSIGSKAMQDCQVLYLGLGFFFSEVKKLQLRHVQVFAFRWSVPGGISMTAHFIIVKTRVAWTYRALYARIQRPACPKLRHGTFHNCIHSHNASNVTLRRCNLSHARRTVAGGGGKRTRILRDTQQL